MNKPINFYSQNFEDVLLARVFADINQGFYVDVGCQHEEEDSVTKYFYERGWSGINIDPVAEYINDYAIRSRDINLCCAAGSRNTSMELTIVKGSGLSSFHQAAIDCAYQHGLHQTSKRWVPVRTLASIFKEFLSPDQVIIFLKLDVEGHELEVIKGAALERYRPIVILAETTQPCSFQPTADAGTIDDYISEYGYKKVFFDGINTWWLAEENFEQRSHFFSYPVGFFDGFSPSQIRQALLTRSAQLQNGSGKRLRDKCASLFRRYWPKHAS